MRQALFFALPQITGKDPLVSSKAKTADFFVNTGISVNIFQKNPKITIILGFSFMYPFGFS